MFAHLTTRYKQMAKGRWGWCTGWLRFSEIEYQRCLHIWQQAISRWKVGVRHWMGATPADREEAAAGLVTRPWKTGAKSICCFFYLFAPLQPRLGLLWCEGCTVQVVHASHLQLLRSPSFQSKFEVMTIILRMYQQHNPTTRGHGECMSFPISPFRGHVCRPPPHGHICPPT